MPLLGDHVCLEDRLLALSKGIFSTKWKEYRFKVMASGFLVKQFKERIDLVRVKPYIKVGASAYALYDGPLPDDFNQSLLMCVPKGANGSTEYCLWIVFGDMNQLNNWLDIINLINPNISYPYRPNLRQRETNNSNRHGGGAVCPGNCDSKRNKSIENKPKIKDHICLEATLFSFSNGIFTKWKKYRFVIMASGYLLKKPLKGIYNKEEICLSLTRPYIKVGASVYDLCSKSLKQCLQLPDEIDPNLLMYVPTIPIKDCPWNLCLWIAFSDMNQLNNWLGLINSIDRSTYNPYKFISCKKEKIQIYEGGGGGART